MRRFVLAQVPYRMNLMKINSSHFIHSPIHLVKNGGWSFDPPPPIFFFYYSESSQNYFGSGTATLKHILVLNLNIKRLIKIE